MRGSLRAVAACAVVLFGAIRLVACGGDESNGAPSPLDNVDADLPDRDLGPDPDADTAVEAGEPDPPPWCNGIVFYASLDGAYGPERGANTPGSPYGNAKLVIGGKFGGATSLFEDGGAGDGSAVYYATPPDGGVPWYSNTTGTVSLWYRGTALEDNGSPVLWRVTGALPPGVIGGGLVLVATAGQFGLLNVTETNQQTNILTFSTGTLARYAPADHYNHFVTAWNRGDAAPPPTAVMMINGGTGKIPDASIDAPSYADAQPNEAGDLLIPYRATRARPWDSDASALAFRLGGTGASASEGEIDDVVVWNRVLSLAEMEAVYKASTAVGTACNLK